MRGRRWRVKSSSKSAADVNSGAVAIKPPHLHRSTRRTATAAAALQRRRRKARTTAARPSGSRGRQSRRCAPSHGRGARAALSAALCRAHVAVARAWRPASARGPSQTSSAAQALTLPIEQDGGGHGGCVSYDAEHGSRAPREELTCAQAAFCSHLTCSAHSRASLHVSRTTSVCKDIVINGERSASAGRLTRWAPAVRAPPSAATLRAWPNPWATTRQPRTCQAAT